MLAQPSPQSQGKLFDRFFESNPDPDNLLWLVAPHLAQEGLSITLHPEAVDIVIQVRRQIEHASTKWIDGRALNDFGERRNDAQLSYDAVFNLQQRRLIWAVRDYVERTRCASISVLDFGCGYGRAITDLLECDFMQNGHVVGITLEDIDEVCEPDYIVRADSTTIRPKDQFDVVVSAYGAAHYCPYNLASPGLDKYKPLNRIFGVLHAMSFVRVGGLLFVEDDISQDNIDILLELGILEQLEKFNEYAITYGREHAFPYVFVVQRQPIHTEVQRLLRFNPDGLYHPHYLVPGYNPRCFSPILGP